MKIKTLLLLLLVAAIATAQNNQFSENFEQTSNSKLLPTGWDGTSDYVAGTSGKNNNYLWRSVAVTRQNNHENANGRCAVLNANNNYTIKSRLKSPVITLSATKYAKLRFKLRNATNAGSQGDFSVYISTDSGTTYLSNIVAQHISTGNVWTDYEYSLAPYIGQNIVLVFEGASSGGSTAYYYFLDNIEITDAPACQNPTSLMISSLTHHSAYFFWDLDPQYGSVPSAYSLQLKDNTGSVVFDTTGYVTIDNSITFTSLLPNTTYTARVMGDCSVEHKGTSDWQELTFTTSAAPAALPMIVTFDSLTSLPAGSLSQNVSLFSASASTTALVYGGAGKSLRLSPSASEHSYFILPPVDVAADSFEVDFKIKCHNGTTTLSDPATFKAGYVTDFSDIVGSFYPVLIDSVVNGADWKSFFFNAYNVGDHSRPVSFCISVDAGSANYLYIDNIDIHRLPSCRRPEGFTASNPTSSSVTLSWTYASSSQVELVAVATDGSVVRDTALSSPFVLSGLLPNTIYDITARTLCSATDTSRWTPEVRIQTQCQAIAAATLNEGFEAVVPNTAPDCWRMGWLAKPAGTTVVSPFSVTSQRSYSGNKSFSFVEQQGGAVAYLSSPLMSFPQAGAYDLTVWVYRKNIANHAAERVEVWATPLENSTTGGTLIGTCYSHYAFGEAEDAAGWYNYQYNVAVQGDYHITFVCYGEGGSIEFDDVTVVPAPACRNVKHLKRSKVGIHDITLAWTPVGNETQWIVDYSLYQQLGDSLILVRDTTEISATSSFAISRLAASTIYDVEATVKALCSSSDTAEGVQISLPMVQTRCEPLVTLPYMTSFETTDQNGTGANSMPQCWSRLNNSISDNFYPYNYLSASYARNGTQSLYFYAKRQGSSPTPDYQVAVLPAVDTALSAVSQLKIRFSAKRVGTESTSYPTLSVGILTDPDDVSTFTLVQDVTINGATYSDYAVALTDYAGLGIYPAFMVVANGAADQQFVVDDVRIEVNNNCDDIVSGLFTSNVKSNSVAVHIIDNTVTDWQASCCTSGVMPDNGILVNISGSLDTTVYGLMSETYYTAYVRRVCYEGNDTVYGAWSVGESFRTKCPAIRTFPYTDDFESHELGLLGGCYDVTSSSAAELKVMQQTATAVMGEIYNHTPGGSRGLMCSDPSSPGVYYPSSGIFRISRIFHLVPGKQYSVSLWGKQFEYYSDYTWKFTIKYGLAPETLVPVQTFTVANKTFQQFKTQFSVATEDDYYITIETCFGDNNSQYYPQIDDLVVDEFSCAVAGNLVVAAMGQTSATIAYTAQDSLWQFALSADSSFVNPLYYDTCTTSTLTITGLQPNTDYYCKARNICSAGDTSKWSDLELIHTKCVTMPLPHSDSFERDNELSCWSSIASGTTNVVFERSNANRVAGYSSFKFRNCAAVSPEYGVDSLTHCFLRGWALAESDNASITINVMTDPDDVSTSSDPVTTLTLPTKNKWYEFVVYFDNLSLPDFEDYRYSRYISFNGGTSTIYLDSVVVETVGACPMPSYAEVSNVSTTGFDISFTSHGSATEWIVYANGEPYPVYSNPATVDGLSPATAYSVKIASSCSDSSVSYPLDCGSVRTLCGIASLPWSTSFEQNEGYTSLSYRQGELEEKCWLTYGVKRDGASYPYYYMSTQYAVSGSQSLDLYNNNTVANANMYVVLPRFQGATNNLRWKFHYMNSGDNAPVLEMGYMADATDTTSFVLLRSLPAVTEWTLAEILTSSFPSVPATARLALRLHRVSSGGTIYVDDISVSQPRSCSDPELPVISRISHDCATLMIVDTCQAHTQWQYCVAPLAADISSLTPVTTSADSLVITGLTPATDYYLYLRTLCAPGDYSNWVRRSFTTQCVPVTLVAGIPFVDSFEDEAVNIPLAGCYDVNGFYDTSNCIKPYTGSSGYNIPHTGNLCLYSVANRSNIPEGISFFRKFSLVQGRTYRVGVYAFAKSHSSDVSILVGTDTTSMAVIASATIDQNPDAGTNYRDYYQYLGNYFVADTTATWFIGVRGYFSGANTSSYLYYDDFSVEELAGCVPTVASFLTASTTTATFLLADTSAASSFQYRVLTEGVEVVPPTAVPSPLFTIDSLAPSSSYTLELRRICGGNSYSEWYSLGFATQCSTLTDFPFYEDFEGDFPPLCWTVTAPDTATWVRYSSASTGYVGSGVGSAHLSIHAVGDYALLSTPELLFNGSREYRLSLKSYINSISVDKDRTLVYLSSSPSSVDNAILLTNPVISRQGTTGMYDFVYEIPEGTNGRYYVVFRGEQNQASYITFCYLDDVLVEMLPECTPLDGLQVVGVSSSSITVSTTLKSDHSAVRFACTAGGNTITSPDCNGSYTFTGLASDTQYSLEAYAICGPGNLSASTPVVTARTTSSDCFAPVSLRTVGIVANDDVTLAWSSCPASTATFYRLYSAGTLLRQGSVQGDTILLTGLSESIAYTFSVANYCSGDTTAWTSLSFTTSAFAFTIPFICDFEDAQQNSHWQMHNFSCPNWFIIGNSPNAVASGSQALYVTNDGGSYNYSSSINTGYGVDAEVLLQMRAGYYSVRYDWKCNGATDNSGYIRDYGRLFLVPASTTIASVQTYMYNAAMLNGVIQTDTRPLNGSNLWLRQDATIEIPADGIYRLVIIFANDDKTGAQPPLAIDNLSVEWIECMPVSSTSVVGVTTNSATLAVRKHEAAKAVQYGFSSVADIDSVAQWHVSANGFRNDTLLFDGLTPNSLYYLFTRHLCDSDSWSTFVCDTIHTPALVLDLPFVCSFEQGEPSLAGWSLTSGASANSFVIGTVDGSGCLHVSNDGFSYAYTVNSGSSFSYAYIPLSFTAGTYEFSYDWRCEGESGNDFARLFLAPLSITLADGTPLAGLTSSALPAGCISLDGGSQLNLSSSWNRHSYASFTVSADNVYNLVVYWHNDSLNGSQPPFALDNITLRAITCPRPDHSAIYVADLQPHTATLAVAGGATTPMRWLISSDSQYGDTVASGILPAGDSLITISGLTSSSLYHAAFRYLCSDSDSSALLAYRFRTSCTLLSAFPYYEGFESAEVVSSSFVNDVLADMCWMVEPADFSTYYAITINSSQTYLGSKALFIDNGSSDSKTQTFALPRFDSLDGKILSLYYKNTHTASRVRLSIGYLTLPDDASSFVTLSTVPLSTSFARAEVIYPVLPAGARAAFRATGRYSLCIDDIRVNDLVSADTLFETVCYNSGYYSHGFSCSASSLHPGDTILQRIAQSTVAGVADSLITISLHILNPIAVTTYDTICAGQNYVKGYWNLTQPTAGIYFDTYTSATGCDSTVNLLLTVIPTRHSLSDTICQGDTYSFCGQTLTAAGTYTGYTLNPRGCTDTVTLYLAVIDSLQTTSATICQGSGYQFEGSTYTQSGTYSVLRQGAHGCSVTKRLILTVIPTDSTINVSFCQGGSVYVVDTMITTAGNYTLHRIGMMGCDLNYHINATIVPVTTEHVYDVACEGHQYYGYGISNLTVTQDTVVTITTRTSDQQCDSIAEIHLRFQPTHHTDTTATIKEGESILWHDQTYSVAGDYPVKLQDDNGCDSIVTLHLVVVSGIGNITYIRIDVVPNPVNAGATTYIYGDFGKITEVEILNNFGQVIDRFTPSAYPIEVNGINATGIYYVRLTDTSGNIYTEKLIVR